MLCRQSAARQGFVRNLRGGEGRVKFRPLPTEKSEESKLDGKGMMTKFGLNTEEQQAIPSLYRNRVAALIGISVDKLPSIHSNGTYTDTPGEWQPTDCGISASTQQSGAKQQNTST